MMDFDPTVGEALTGAAYAAVFPDGETLIAKSIAEQDEKPDVPEYAKGRAPEYRWAKVPEVPVYVLYGIYPNPQHAITGEEPEGDVLIVCIRTHKGVAN